MYLFLKLATTLIKARYRSPLKLEDESVLHLRAGFSDVDMFMELNNARYLKGTSVNSTFYLATPKIQNQGMGTQNAYCLSSGHNTESVFLAKPQRASFQGLIFVVMSLVKTISVPFETCLESEPLKARR